MANEVHQHPDNLVYVRTAAKTYGDTTAHFQTDFGVTLPALPSGANERIYTVGARHAIQGGGTVIAGGPLPWPQGDQIIANLDAGLAAQAARVAATPPPVIEGKKEG